MSNKLTSKIVIIGVISLASINAHSQTKQVDTREQLWLGFFNQTRFTKRSGLWVDLHLRQTDHFVNRSSISIGRIGYTYYLSDQTRLTAGYAYATQYSLASADVPEHRFWQQIQWHEKKNGFTLMQWLRIEERNRRKVFAGVLSDEYAFNWRFRYNFALTLPLQGKVVLPKTAFLFFNNEVHINAGKEIVNNYFDQNRLFLGLGFQFSTHLNAHLGYMNVFQQLPEGNKYVKTDAIRLFVFYNLDLRNGSD